MEKYSNNRALALQAKKSRSMGKLAKIEERLGEAWKRPQEDWSDVRKGLEKGERDHKKKTNF